MAEPLFISVKDAARLTGISRTSLREWCNRGLIRSVRVGDGDRPKIMVSRRSLLNYLEVEV